MNKKLLISVFLLILIFMLWLSAPAPAYADRLEVLPTDHDFGDVEVGTTVTTIISITNINGTDVIVNGIGFQAGGSGDFSLTSYPPVPFVLTPGEMVEVAVAFTPSAGGYVTAVLEIESSDMIEPHQMVSLGGVGGAVQPHPVTVEDILNFLDQSVIAGTLAGKGHGKSALARLFVFRNMIKIAGKLIDRGRIRAACRLLLRAYKRCDGMLRPPDFVEGDDVPELNTMILEFRINTLGCN